MNKLIKNKVSLVFITFYFSFLSELIITFFGESKFTIVSFIYVLLALLSYYIYIKVGGYSEETIAGEFFSSIFAIGLVYFPIVACSSIYSNWLFAPLFIFLLAYPFLYLNKCCMDFAIRYKEKREISKRTFNFNNVYIGSLVMAIMYVFQVYSGLDDASIVMLYIYVFYSSYIFLYIFFIGTFQYGRSLPVVDLIIVLLVSILFGVLNT